MYVFFRHFLKKCLQSLWSRDYDYKQIQDARLKTRKNGNFQTRLIFYRLWINKQNNQNKIYMDLASFLKGLKTNELRKSIKKKSLIVFSVKPFVPNAAFLHPLKTSGSRKVFWYFQRIEKGCIRNELVKYIMHSQYFPLISCLNEFTTGIGF